MNTLRTTVAVFLVGTSFSLSAQTPSPTTPATVVRATRGAAKLPSGTRGNAMTTIQGNALTSTNGQLADVVVRLRDARFGRIVDTQTTDKSGLFTFRGVEPGSYIVELMAADETTVLTASQILTVNAGEAISAVVKLPFSIPPFAGVMGNATPSSIAAIATQAATSGIAAITSVGAATCPLQ